MYSNVYKIRICSQWLLILDQNTVKNIYILLQFKIAVFCVNVL